MKDMNKVLTKQYIGSFYLTIAKEGQEKEIKQLRKKVEKYEDISYLKDAVNDETKELIIKRYKSHKSGTIHRYQTMISDLSEYKRKYLDGKEIIDINAARKELDHLDKQLQNITDNEYLREINALVEFKNNIDVEYRTYIKKHKEDEYMDMAVFHTTIDQIFKEVNELLVLLIKDNELEEQEYLIQYLNYFYHLYESYFEEYAKGGYHSLPSWAKGLLFCAPWIVGFIAFTAVPLVQTLVFSFSKVNLTTNGFEMEPIGFTNYINIFSSDTDFILALKNYLVEMIVYVPLITIFSLALAMLLNTKIKSKGFFRTIFFFPVIITSGPVIKILIEQGVTAMPGVATLMNVEEVTAQMPELVRIAFNILTSEFTMILWFSGIQILVFVTGLQKIDKGVYEASAIDGANKWEQFWKVTLPAINPTIIINVVFTVVMQSIFALNPIILKIQSDMNDTGEGKGYGYSSALAFTYFLIMIIVLVIFVLIFKKKNKKKGAI